MSTNAFDLYAQQELIVENKWDYICHLLQTAMLIKVSIVKPDRFSN